MNWIETKLSAFDERIAGHEAGQRWTYRDLRKSIHNIAAQLPSTRAVIAIQTETSIEGIAALLAIAQTQHIALPLPAELTAVEQADMQKIAAANYRLIGTGENITLVDQAPSERPKLYKQLQRSGLVLFSSGTSGQPKGMLHNLDALLSRYKSINTRQDRSLLLLLIDHIGGLDSAFRTLFAGSTLVIPETRTPEAAGAAIAKHSVNILPASPTFLNLMCLAHTPDKHNCSSVEIIAYGAEAMPTPLLRRVAEAFPHADLQQKFGTSETGAVHIKSENKNSLFFKIEDRDTEWKVIEEELWLKTPSRIIGYLNADESSLEADGWYRTGDLVEEGSDGYIRIIGRASAMINVGGQKVHPAEIEAVLREIPEVEACHAASKADPITGQVITCTIFSQSNEDLRTWKRKIRNHCRGKLAPWKIPTHLSIETELKTNTRLKQQ